MECSNVVASMFTGRFFLRTYLGLLSISCLWANALQAQPSFTVTNYPTSGGEVYDVEVGDFNNDGNLDFIAPVDGSFGKLWVFLGDGSGGFAAPTTINAPDDPAALVAGHFDADNNLDLAVTYSSTNMLAIFLGNGNGTFTFNAQYTSGGQHPRAIVTSDFDNDGDLDIAVGNRKILSVGNENVALFNGAGNGSFSGPNIILTPASPVNGPYNLAVANFNNDSYQDLAVVNSGFSGTIGVYLQGRVGTFTPPLAPFPLQFTKTRGVTAADFDEDGNTDLAAGSDVFGSPAGFNAFSVALGNGDGTFGADQHFATNNDAPRYLASADFDGDCHIDLVGALKYSNMAVALGNGNGGFGNPSIINFGFFSQKSTAVKVGDFNNDDRPDVIVANLYGDLSVAINTTPPPMGTPTSLVISGAEWPPAANGTYVLAGSLNGKPRYTFNDNTLWWTSANYWNLHDDNEQRFTHGTNTAFPPANGWLQMPSNKPSAMIVKPCY